MTVAVRTAVPVLIAGLLLVACANGDGRPAAAAAAPGGATSTTSADSHTLTTRGQGKASGTPDTLTVMIGVSTQDSSAKAALDANNAKATTLIGILRKHGVAAKDLQTSQLSINPTYNDKAATISGYQVDDTVQATLHTISGAGALLDAAAGAVGNAVRLQQIGLSISDDSALRAQARAQAVTRAQAQAAQIAKAGGASLGRIRSITELFDIPSPMTYDLRAVTPPSAAVPLQAGQQDLTATVEIVYDIT
jgi:uncharacterized protein YggE